MEKFTGIIPALSTPINGNNVVKEQAAQLLIQDQLARGVHGFYICGSTGEGLLLPVEERKKMCEITVCEVHGKVPVINHVGALNLNTAIELAIHAQQAGADCIASIPPFYFVYDEDDIYQYYKCLASSVSIPVMVYYLPAGGVRMNARLIRRIFEIDNVTSVKWSSSDYFEMLKLKDATNGEINIINGPDETLICGLAAGADGGIGATYSIMPEAYIQLYESFCNNKMEQAQQLQSKVNRVTEVLLAHKVLPSVKLALEARGIPVGNTVYPMKHFDSREAELVMQDLHRAGWPF